MEQYRYSQFNATLFNFNGDCKKETNVTAARYPQTHQKHTRVSKRTFFILTTKYFKLSLF